MIRVLVVDDDPVAVEAHARYVQRVPGFEVAGRAGSATEAIRFLASDPADLVLLDVNMPDASGLAVVRKMRTMGIMTDVIAVTGVRELETVRAAVSLGVLHYVLKPFTFATLAERLRAYADYRSRSRALSTAVSQGEIDAVVGPLRPPVGSVLPKGLSENVLVAASEVVKRSWQGSSASDVALALGVSRVTARRYLEHLVDITVVVRRSRPGANGRPTVEYVWASEPGAVSHPG